MSATSAASAVGATDAQERQRVDYRLASPKLFTEMVEMALEALRASSDLSSILARTEGAEFISLFDANGQEVRVGYKDLKKLSRMAIAMLEKAPQYFKANYKPISNKRSGPTNSIQKELLWIDPAIQDFLLTADFGPFTENVRQVIAAAVSEGVIIKKTFNDLFMLHLYALKLANPKPPKESRVKGVKGQRNDASYHASPQILKDFGSDMFPILKQKSADGKVDEARRQGEMTSAIEAAARKAKADKPISSDNFSHIIANSWITNHSYSLNAARRALKEGWVPYVADVPAYASLADAQGYLRLNDIVTLLENPAAKVMAEETDARLNVSVFDPTTGQKDNSNNIIYMSKAEMVPGYVTAEEKREKAKARKERENAAGLA
jgi:hypothetical protein